jgi:hypothetical protein
MSSDPIYQVPLTERIVIPAVMILGVLASVTATAIVGYGIVALMHL